MRSDLEETQIQNIVKNVEPHGDDYGVAYAVVNSYVVLKQADIKTFKVEFSKPSLSNLNDLRRFLMSTWSKG